MPHGFIGFAAFLFVGFTFLNRVLEGIMIGAGDVTILNQLSVFRSLTLFSTWSIPVPNLDFITVALPRIFTWDYTFFGGMGGLIQYLLYSVTAAASFGLFVLTIGLLYNYFGFGRR
jgi:hypothetical protein